MVTNGRIDNMLRTTHSHAEWLWRDAEVRERGRYHTDVAWRPRVDTPQCCNSQTSRQCAGRAACDRAPLHAINTQSTSHYSLTGVTSFHVLSSTTKLHTCTNVKHQYITARLVSDMRKFDHSLWQLMRVDLHWLGVSERVKFKLMSMVHNCIHHKAPRYLKDYCIPISDVASRQLRSAKHHYLVVPRHSLRLYGRQAFAVAGPTAWNWLSDDLRDLMHSTDSFRRLLKTQLFSEYYLHTVH